MNMGTGAQNLFSRIVKLVRKWNPNKAYDHESKFQKELQNYLDKSLNENSSGGMTFFGNQREEHVVDREHGSSRADIAVDEKIGIEMKRDLSNSQRKKLMGQIEDYLDHYNYVIVCACGIEDMSGWRKVKKRYSQGGFGIDPQSVVFIHKREENFGKKSRSKENQGNGMFGMSKDGNDLLGI